MSTQTSILIIFILLPTVWTIFVLVNPFHWALFMPDPRTEVGKSLAYLKGIQRLKAERDWGVSLSQLRKLSTQLRQIVAKKDSHLGLLIRREIGILMSNISYELESKPLRLQRFSGFMWLAISSHFTDMYAGERSKTPLDVEAAKMMADWVDVYQDGVTFQDVRICFQAIANLMFIAATGKLPREENLAIRPTSSDYLLNFKKEIIRLADKWPSNTSLDDIDTLLSKWGRIALTQKDPYLFLILLYLDTYRISFSMVFQVALRYRDNYSAIRHLLRLNNLRGALKNYARGLTDHDLLSQYSSSVTLATLAQFITGIENKKIICRHLMESI